MVNTKNANTFTGKQGFDGIDAVAKSLAKNLTIRVQKKKVYQKRLKPKTHLLSTGVIGETFPADKITNRIYDLFKIKRRSK